MRRPRASLPAQQPTAATTTTATTTATTSQPQTRAALPQQESLTWANIAGQLHADIVAPQPSDDATVDDSAPVMSSQADADDTDLTGTGQTVNDTAALTFAGGDPLAQELVLVQCRHCRKSVLPSSFAAHSRRCEIIRTQGVEALIQSRPVSPATSAATAQRLQQKRHSSSASGRVTRARHRSDMAMAAVLAQLPAVEQARLSNPYASLLRGVKRPASSLSAAATTVDLDKQCGVRTLAGVPCMGPLSCSAHSINAKYAVPGRSADFFDLLRQSLGVCSSSGTVDFKLLAPLDTNMDQQESRTEPVAPIPIESVYKSLQKFSPPIVAQWHTCTRRQITSMRMRDVFFAVLNKRHLNAFAATSALGGQQPMEQALLYPDEDPLEPLPAAMDIVADTAAETASVADKAPKSGTTAARPPRKSAGGGSSRSRKKATEQGDAAPARRRPSAAAKKTTPTPTLSTVELDLGPGVTTLDPRDLKLM